MKGCLVRMEVNAATQQVRLTVRTHSAPLNACIASMIKAQLEDK